MIRARVDVAGSSLVGRVAARFYVKNGVICWGRGGWLATAGQTPASTRRFVMAQGHCTRQQRPLLAASTNRLWPSDGQHLASSSKPLTSMMSIGIVKKLKVSEDTRSEVSASTSVVEYSLSSL
jgi:hypothetical protein